MPTDPKKQGVELSLRLTDGTFESRITMPLDASAEGKKRFAAAWLQLMETGLKLVPGKVADAD